MDIEAIRYEHGRFERLLIAIAAVFVFVNALSLSLVEVGHIAIAYLWAPAVWLVLILGAHFLLLSFKPTHDPFVFSLIGFLLGWGILLIHRLAVNFLARQLVWIILGVAVLLAAAITPPSLRFLRRYRYTWLIGGLLLLAMTLFLGVNPSGFGAQLWLQIPFIRSIYFQPSELLKLLLVVFLASYFADREALLKLKGSNGKLGPLPYLAPLLLMWGFCMVLLVWQRDLGAATLFFFLFVALLYLASGEMLYVVGGMGLLLAAGVFAYYAFDVVALRVDAWLNPWPEADNRAFQIVQSLYAIAAGGVFGQGIGQGFPDYIPVVHSDFAFAAVAEEWGMIGSLTLIICFALLTYRGFRIAMGTRRPFERYLAAGIALLIGAQTLMIMAGVTKLLPLTGVTLPFVSYGGSSLLISCLMMGLLLYISSESRT